MNTWSTSATDQATSRAFQPWSLGGNCISIVGGDTVNKGYELARGKRTTVGPYTSNYRKGSDPRLMLDTIINKVGYLIAARNKESKAL